MTANPDQWSVESKRSYSFHYGYVYKDIAYQCRCCKANCIFTAQDQQYNYEVKKANISQRRALCADCWLESHRIRESLRNCERMWAQAKPALQKDEAFLTGWLALMTALEKYFPYRSDIANKNMLAGFLASLKTQ
ncbi:MAG TPA: zinc-ribbon domain containing protein [Burkholderiaceae bacterium]